MEGNVAMIAGLTYDLKEEYRERGFGEEETAEFDKEETVDAIENVLQDMGMETERIGGVSSLVSALSAGKRWDIVFNIAEGMYGIGREAQVPALLDAYGIPYTFSDPLVLSLTLHKGMTKRVVRDCGVPTADFAVLQDKDDLRDLKLPFPLFLKPVAEGTGKGIDASSLIHDRRNLETVFARLLRTFAQPVLVETYLPGREFTVGILGTGKTAHALPVMEIVLRDSAEKSSYSYENKQNYHDRVEYRLTSDGASRECADVALRAWRCLGCRDAGRVDLRLDVDGVPNFIEVNPLAGLNPIDSDLPIICTMAGIDYGTLIQSIMESALQRTGGLQQVKPVSCA
jgi:D-alanine-D-alanine ligase